MIRTVKAVAPLNANSLPSLVRRAADQLASATSAAEILDARDIASVAYDASKKAARLAKAKGAHDELIAKAHRTQADALEIEAAAKRRLADEYDAAQDRGEVAGQGKPVNIPDGNVLATASDIGLTAKDVHEARQIRDAEKIDPGIVRRTLDEKLSAGQEPTKAALREATDAAAKHFREQSREALPQAIKDREAAKADAIAARKTKPVNVDALIAENDELREANAALETQLAEAKSVNAKWQAMRVQFEQGGFEQIIAGKDEEIRVLQTRVEAESRDKALWANKTKFWKGEAIKLGWKNGDFTVDIETGEVGDV